MINLFFKHASSLLFFIETKMRLSIAILALLLFPVFGFAQNGGSGSELIDDHYFITFKASAGVIDPPNPANQVPIGQHSSGQNKEELAQTLGLDGEILRIFDALNAIYVRMGAQEAERWRQDGRVENVEQDRTGVFAVNEPENEFPYYRDGVLTIPRVDTDEQPAAFVEGKFVFDSDSNSWRLRQYKPSDPVEEHGRSIYFLEPDDGVDIEIVDSHPVQVFLRIRGHLANGCLAVKGIHQRLKNNRFEVAVTSTGHSDGNFACTQALVPFERVVPLQVYGLPRGTYGYVVNGEVDGSFELTKDNSL